MFANMSADEVEEDSLSLIYLDLYFLSEKRTFRPEEGIGRCLWREGAASVVF